MEKGSFVELETFDHQTIEARVVEVRGRTAVVCSNAEWQAAEHEHRDPVTVGWPRSSVKTKEPPRTKTKR